MTARFVLQPAAGPVVPSTPGPGAADCVGAVDTAWEQALSDYQHVLDQHRELLARVEQGEDVLVLVPAFAPPDGISPLPESMLSWAEALSRATDELVQQATEFLERTRPALTPTRVGRFVTESPTSFDRKM